MTTKDNSVFYLSKKLKNKYLKISIKNLTGIHPMTTQTEDIISFAQEIIINDNVKLHAKIKELKDKLSNLKSSIDKLIVENDQLKIDNGQLKIDNNQLKADLSEKTLENNQLKIDNNQLKTALSDKTTEYNKLYGEIKNILIANKSLKKRFQKLPSMICNKTVKNDEIEKIMKNYEYEKLLSYKFFDAKYLFSRIYNAIIIGMRIDIMKHILDNCLDLNVEVNIDMFASTRLIHLFSKNSNPKLIQYLIDKGVELECPNRDGYYPLHIICASSTPSMIKYIISKGVNLKSNPKIDLAYIINHRPFTNDEKKELLALIE